LGSTEHGAVVAAIAIYVLAIHTYVVQGFFQLMWMALAEIEQPCTLFTAEGRLLSA
jgi:hypothetical protein